MVPKKCTLRPAQTLKNYVLNFNYLFFDYISLRFRSFYSLGYTKVNLYSVHDFIVIVYLKKIRVKTKFTKIGDF